MCNEIIFCYIGRRIVWNWHSSQIQSNSGCQSTWVGMLVWCTVQWKVTFILLVQFCLLFYWSRFCHWSYQLIYHEIVPNPQYCTTVAYHCPWFAYNALVSVTLCSLPAHLCHGRTRNYWQTALDCPQCTELHHLFNIVRLVFYFLLISIHLAPSSG